MSGDKGPVHTVRVRIEGSVQGVGYRVWAQRRAQALGLSGWVRNRRNGAVEALFSGPQSTVAEMLKLCHEGPWSATVETVAVVEEGGPAPSGFSVLPTA
jgi:acylphosphatase